MLGSIMKKEFLALILLLLIFKLTSAQGLKKEYQDVVQTFIDCIENQNMEKLKTLVEFPFRRKYPLPDIKNATEFIEKYDEIFDKSLTNAIVNSDIQNDWSVVGWRGLMLDNGILWLGHDGQLIAVNYQSSSERNKREKLIENDKKSIHESLKKFEQPKLLLETEKFRIRIDELSPGVYRYASWSINSTMNEKPDLVIENGGWTPEGSGGNNMYEFVSGDYKYECSINVIGTDETPPADLTVYKNDNEILYQPAQIIRN